MAPKETWISKTLCDISYVQTLNSSKPQLLNITVDSQVNKREKLILIVALIYIAYLCEIFNSF